MNNHINSHRSKDLPFGSIYSHGFIRVAVCIPFLKVADPEYNVERIIGLARQASKEHAAVALFPELGLTAYSNDDLFHQDALLDAAKSALVHVVNESRDLLPVIIVGAPLRFDGKLFNCAIVIYRGRILGIVPKSFLPNYREYYEKRQFCAARDAVFREVQFMGNQIPFGSSIIFDVVNVEGFKLHVELCEDLWAPIPPSTFGALAGATVLANLSASNITIGKADYRRSICASQSAKTIAAYLYSVAGPGESTTDLAWDGYALIYENNDLLAESERFVDNEQVVVADIDLERLQQDRMRTTSFNDSTGDWRDQLQMFRNIPFEFEVPQVEIPLMRKIERFPYVPSDPEVHDQRCYEVYNIQVHGLMKRLSSAGIEKVVIGVSGGLDSTHALIVCVRTMDRLKLPRKNILGYTMPGLATSAVTHQNARKLMDALDITVNELDIRPSSMQMLKDIGHPHASGHDLFDVTFENVQAGERTSHLFRLANYHQAIVIGTGDLSELALGWTTYGVGDHMSHYNVNGSVPKTLIQYLIRWVIKTFQLDDETLNILQSIVETEISPELVPNEDHTSDQPGQLTEMKIGPYELQDFNLYYTIRFGYRPSKIAYLAHHAWSDRTQGTWPALLPGSKHHEYDLGTIKKWLEVFLYRFFKISQFKRSVMPNGPKVGSGGSLSPRGDWRAPSDSEATVWLEDLHHHIPD